MKKGLLFIAAAAIATTTFAQDGLTSKKGEAYLPEAGDWSIGFSAADLTNYAGNLFNGGSNGALNMGWMNDQVGQEIRIKMFKDEQTAYRLRARIGTSSVTNTTNGTYDADNDPSTADVDYSVETKTAQGFSVVLGAGMEKRRGNTRIQGYYGGEVYLGLLGGQTVTTADSRTLNDDYTNGGAPRTTEDKGGSTFAFGLQGFIGVEWFFAPKVSLGAEYTYGLGMTSTGEGEVTTEYWGIAPGSTATTASLQTETAKGASSSAFSFDTGMRGDLNLNFHF